MTNDEIQYVDDYKVIRVHIFNSNTLLIFLTVVVDNDRILHKLFNKIIRTSEIGNIACYKLYKFKHLKNNMIK